MWKSMTDVKRNAGIIWDAKWNVIILRYWEMKDCMTDSDRSKSALEMLK